MENDEKLFWEIPKPYPRRISKDDIVKRRGSFLAEEGEWRLYQRVCTKNCYFLCVPIMRPPSSVAAKVQLFSRHYFKFYTFLYCDIQNRYIQNINPNLQRPLQDQAFICDYQARPVSTPYSGVSHTLGSGDDASE